MRGQEPTLAGVIKDGHYDLAKVEDCSRVGGKTRANQAGAVCQELGSLEGWCLGRESYRNQATRGCRCGV